MKTSTSFNSLKAIVRLASVVCLLAVGIENAWGTTYTFNLNSSTAGNGGAVTYWYSDAKCNTHVCKYYSTNNPTTHYNRWDTPYTMYYKDAIITTAKTFVACAAGSGNYVYFHNNGYFIFGKTNSYLTLPTFSGEKITNVTVTTSSSVAGDVEVNIYSDDNAASLVQTTTSSTSQDLSFDITNTYQNDELKIKVGSNKNLQITQIIITTASASNTITLNRNNSDASGSSNGSATIADNATSLSSISAPTRIGYTLEGYYTNAVCTTKIATSAGALQANITVGGNTWTNSSRQWKRGANETFYAKWTAKSATLSFNQNGGEGGQSENKTATYGQAMPTPIATPTKFGHIFGGYYDGVGGTGNKYYNADGTSARNWDKNTESTTTLYAKWTEKDLTNYRTMCESVYDIVLDDNNGGSNNGSARVEANRSILSAIVPPTRTGYEVEGYYTDDACTAANKISTNEGALLPNVSTWTNGSSQWVKGAGATFYTKWSAIEYTISYEGLEGASNSNSTSYTVATPTFALENPGSREGYTFTGWTCGGDAITQIALGTTGNKTITATWSLNSHTLAVSAEENVTISATPASASTIAEGSNASVNYGKTVTLNGEPDEHFAMTWKVYKTGDESTVVSVSGEGDGATFTMPDYNVTITVVKTEDPKKTVSFYNNGTQVQSGYVYVGERPSAPTLDEEDACDDERNTHYGWSTSTWTNVIDTKASLDEDYTVYFKDVSLPVVAAENPSEITYHAVWSKQEGELSYEYQLVTDIANLSAGDKIVIATGMTGSVYVMGKDTVTGAGYQFRKYAQIGTLSVSESKITISTTATSSTDRVNPHIFTMGKSGNYWTFYDPLQSAYIACASTSDKNGLGYEAELSNAGKWDISFNENKAIIQSQIEGDIDRDTLSTNGNTITSSFTCRKGTYYPYIFRSLSTAVFSEFLTTCCSHTIDAPSVDDSKTAYTVTLSWDAVETANGNASSYEMQWNGGDWTTVTSPVVKSELTPNTAYTWKVRVKTWTGEYYCAAEEASGSTTTNPVYTVTYNAGGGTGSMAVVSYEAGDAVTVLTNGFTWSGYNWDSWSYSPAVEVSEGQFSMPASNVIITAQWTAKALNSISLAESAISVYVGEIKYVDVIYDPSDILTKGFTQVSTPSYCQIGTFASNMQAKITGGRSDVTITEDSVETVSIKANADNTKTASIEVTVKPLPKVTFIDIVQDKTDFSGGDTYDAETGVLKSMVTAGVVDHTLTVPSHADVAAPGTGNTCEQQHLHLMGWIRGDWADPYMAVPDGTLPGRAAILEVDEEDGTIYIAVGEEIDLEALNGKTYYAVWAKAE